MSNIPLTEKPGYVARLTRKTARQRQMVGKWLDMANPAKVWAAALHEQRLRPDEPLRLDVMSAPTWKAKIVQTLELKDYTGLGAPESDPAIPSLAPAMSPTSFSPISAAVAPVAAPQAAALMPTVIMPQVPPVSEPPPGMDAMSQFIFREQGRQLQQATFRQYELQQQLVLSDQEKAALKTKLDEANMELRHKDREHEGNIRDMKRDLQDEMETESKPTGMNGLMEAVSNPAHPLAGLIGVLASQLLPKVAGGGASAGDEGSMGGHSKNITDILNGIAELIPDDEFGTKLYLALAKILPHPDGLSTLQQMATNAAA